ncbi:DUF2892 domain-containing protein [Geobacillus sp. G4]|uniref:Inner membrane protein YgaP-like transmembrane domain-containing protein n=6 Tax=Geobacillus TaxID=129337 RepID=A0A7U9P7S1_GEOTM|nr:MULTISPECIES: DUF2892 domain-containing protein [Geobacillus]AEV17683.1 hypothetical protein GTCCBUS3UF5_3570 [Geobacillus thermoleovorans CCB_US3_UF5]AMV09644.1 hypothetical protein GT3570_01470 [Geobacillus thermoleovorans]AOL33256.1 hypothetical protein BGM21_01130 [Geobacillus thermoleovorans]AUI36622.1 DUF2892 domain-containing protein [[Bacillus] caldolyticus]AWO74123.1 DUF2892 domain-containing protein [Geobacillus thermoleovorans]
MANIGIVNAFIRITVGLTVIAWATARLARRPWCTSYLWAALLGAMKVGEGITRFCPMTALFDNMQRRQLFEEEKEAVVNPT